MAEIIEITDFSDPRLDVYARLREPALKNGASEMKSLFIAESPNVIERAINYPCRPVSMLLEPRHVDGQCRELIERAGDIPVFTAPDDVLTQITGFHLTRGALCCMERPEMPAAETLLSAAHRIAVLEDVVNPTNIGAIFRSAAALSVDAVLLTPNCCDPFYRRAIRVSMGTVFQVPWAFLSQDPADWPEKGLALLKSYGFQTAAMSLTDRTIPIDDPVLQDVGRLAIVLGTEGDGLTANTIASCDFNVKIPMRQGVDSLNVAAAGAVAFYALRYRGQM
ncbi:MAG: RNA methyltransferase [Lachnospiraceae bacterium]|nr:RNA methyltransferase [Lachnospiraceae bacterium]